MKRLLCCVLALICCIASGCAATPAATEAANGALVDIEYLGIYKVQGSLDEYYNHLETYQKQIPETFVHLDDLPSLGTFLGFVPTPYEFPNQYEYGFADNNDKVISLKVTHLSGSGNNTLTSEYSFVTVTEDMTSMIKIPNSKGKSIIISNGFEYYYGNKSSLTKIVWYSDGIQYALSGQLNHKGIYNNSLIKQLLSVDDAEFQTACDAIKQALSTK